MAATTAKRKKPARPRQEQANEGQYYSRAVAKSLEILQILSSSRQALALNQLATMVRLTKPSVFRLLYTLETTGYVIKREDGRYALNQDIRRSVRDRLISTLVEHATPKLRELTREFRETTGLAVLFENHIEVVAVVESPQTIRMGNTVGRILQPHASSLGKCITAFQPEDRREHLLRSYGISPFTENTITDEQALHEELETIRASGVATDRGETCLEGYCFAAPIFDPQDEVFAAISMSMPRIRLGSEENQQRILEKIKAASAGVTALLRA